MKHLYLLLFILLINSCINNTEKEKLPSIIYKELCNGDLRSAIIEYQAKIEDENNDIINKGDSVYVGVYVKNINDSIKRFVLWPIIDYTAIKFSPTFFLCSVNGFDVFFVSDDTESCFNYFELSEENLWLFIKRYFPNRYKQYKIDGHFSNKRTCHSSLCHLTFLNDSLIDKTYQKGFYKDRVLVNVNGKGEWY